MFGCSKELSDDAVMQVDNFISDRGHPFNGKGHKGCIAPLRL
jgi:hypothetical protein